MTAPVVIVNPSSAGGQTRARWPRIEGELREAFGQSAELGSFRHVFTERGGHATELARDALVGGASLVIAMGGDGTLNEVVNGFFDAEGAPVRPGAAVGLLPAGTGGDFSRSVDAPRAIRDAAARIAAATPRPIDVGRIAFLDNDGKKQIRHFINVCSFGISGVVDRFVNRSSKALGGKVGYFLATVRATLAYKNARVRISFDDREAEEQAVYCVAISNGRYFGGGMKIAPKAEIDDGLFDVVTLGDVAPARILVEGTRIYGGNHLDLPYVSSTRARKVRAESARGEEVLLDVDGEQPGRLPATFEVLPSAIHARF
jgi:YegS/Rv2252/BmrU family lipid kinase